MAKYEAGRYEKGRNSVFNELAGMDLAQLREEINKLYREYADMGNNPPAIMVMEIIPGMRKGVSPANPEEEKAKKEEIKWQSLANLYILGVTWPRA